MKAVVSIDYNETQSSYKGLHYNVNGSTGSIYSGDLIIDWIDMYKLFHEHGVTTFDQDASVIYFAFAGNQYHFKVINGHEYVTEPEMHTMKELREYYDQYKSNTATNPFKNFL